jgi:cation:H+ antiporter
VPDFADLSLTSNLAIFAAAAACVWVAGTRLADAAERIAERTGLSRAFLGLLLLGIGTSLPEIATTTTAAASGNAALVAGNLFGGVSLQIAVLAIADAVAVRGALTHFATQPVLLFQGVMLLLLLGVALGGAAIEDPPIVFGLGLTPMLLAVGYVATVRYSREHHQPGWRAEPMPSLPAPTAPADQEPVSVPRMVVEPTIAGLVILAAGWALATTGEVLAEQTGLGASFVGVALVAASTSLPELSTTLGAIRHNNYSMAVSNILGTNCLEVALFFLADIVYGDGPILAATDRSATFAATLAIVVTCVFLLGLLQRRNRTIFGMGLDSLSVILVYLGGLVVLYVIR